MWPVEFSLTHYLPVACLPYRKTENFAMNHYDYNRNPAFFPQKSFDFRQLLKARWNLPVHWNLKFQVSGTND